MNTRTNMEKGVPLSCWTPCPSEPKLGNVTTGLERDSLNRIENLKVPICTRNVYLIKALSCFENCGIKKSKFWYKLYSFLQISFIQSSSKKERDLSIKIRSFTGLRLLDSCSNEKTLNQKGHEKMHIIYYQAGLMSFL